jgi:hypothetical protein
MSGLPVREVFKSLGVPTSTYVRRDRGKFERELNDTLNTKGKLALLTGPSKTGKSTLYSHVLAERQLAPLTIRCDQDLTTSEFWRRALEQVNFERISALNETSQQKISAGAKVGGKIGWSWLANLLGEVNLGIEGQTSEAKIREKILSQPSPSHLIPILKHLPLILVVEDFHYLSEAVKRSIFQQWKAFVDNEVSVIVVGTTHHAADLAHANSDLVGRIAQIDLNTWSSKDLEAIAMQGFLTLGVRTPNAVIALIAEESAGLPIVTQETSAQVLIDKGWDSIDPGKEDITVSRSEVIDALHKIATSHYKHFDVWYERIRTGPRERARKYNTYELVLITFCEDPLTFFLRRNEIDARIAKLNLTDGERPPAASINSTLAALAKFQKKNSIELLEWSEKDQRLYILEPAFLFYLRWKEKRNVRPSSRDLLQMLRDLADRLSGGKKDG